uniref:VP n=1 Tax=uncultured densovirus TaxID=748192 RepID=A0A7L7YTH2_9VIRU|nr:VP [uncultured densovirus]
MSGRYKWRWDSDNWPDQRINWNDMTRSQKAYTIKQYNKARSARSIPPINNPFARDGTHIMVEKTNGVVDSETITFPTVGRPKITPISGSAAPTAGDKGALATLMNAQHSRAEQAEIDDITNYFNTDEGLALIDTIAANNDKNESAQYSGSQAPYKRAGAPVTDAGPVAGPSGLQVSAPSRSQAPPPPTAPMATRGSKRTAPDQGAGPSSTSAGTSGKNSASDGGFDSTQGPMHQIPNGGYSTTPGSMSFTKTHQLAIWSLPYTKHSTLDKLGANIFSTPLAAIDWEYMYFYMSPEEFQLIPAGSRVESCNVEFLSIVAQSGYPTGGTTASQSVTNHPKIMCLAHGLTQKCRGGFNRVVTISDTMIPSSPVTEAAQVTDFIAKQYGTDQNAADNLVTIPGVVTDIPYFLKKYWHIYQPNKVQAAIRGFTANTSPGFEYFKNMITQINANDVTWSTLEEANLSYQFTSAPIGAQFAQLEIDTEDVHQSVGGANNYNMIRKVTNLEVNGDTTITESIVASNRASYPLVTYKSSKIEKGSTFVHGDSAGKPCNQPSFHIGLKAIEKSLPSNTSTRASEFVQARMTLEVRATIRIVLPSYPNRFTRPKFYNTGVENTVAGIGLYQDDESAITFGIPNVSNVAPQINSVDATDPDTRTEDGLQARRHNRAKRGLPSAGPLPPQKVLRSDTAALAAARANVQ